MAVDGQKDGWGGEKEEVGKKRTALTRLYGTIQYAPPVLCSWHKIRQRSIMFTTQMIHYYGAALIYYCKSTVLLIHHCVQPEARQSIDTGCSSGFLKDIASVCQLGIPFSHAPLRNSNTVG